VDRGQYRSAPVRGARNYAGVCDGVVYFLLSFDNPNSRKTTRLFSGQTQLRVNELRNSEVSAGHEISNWQLKGPAIRDHENPITEEFHLPRCAATVTRQRIACWRKWPLAKTKLIQRWNDFCSQLQISEKPDGKDIGTGATYADLAPLLFGVHGVPAYIRIITLRETSFA